MNKQLNLISLLLILFITSCANKTKSNENKVVTISYSNEIEGYTVTAIWKPIKVSYDHVVGPAIIEFKNKKYSTSFNLTNNNFSILKSKLPFTYSDDSCEIKNFNKDFISLFYDETNLKPTEGFGTTNEPFFFQDLNFNNKRELLMTEVENGQRGIATFKAYDLEDAEMAREIYAEPFKSLDQMSKIDNVNKKIILYSSNGWCADGTEIYKLQISKNDYEANKYILDIIIQYEMDYKLDKCFELLYKVNNNSRQLISKKEIK